MDVQSMERWNSLSVSEIRVLRELLERIDRGDERIPIRSVAQSAFVSATSIVRLAKKLGFDGFSELLYSLKHERLSPFSSSMQGLFDQMVTTEESRIELDKLSKELCSGTFERINCMGIGYSDLVARYFCDRLLECGFFATTKSPLDFRDDRSCLTILISESGETKDLMFIQERIQSRDAQDFVFTADAASALGMQTRHRVLVKRKGQFGDNESNYFVVNCMMLIEGLMVAVRNQKRKVGTL